jgi:hypothetical protein
MVKFFPMPNISTRNFWRKRRRSEPLKEINTGVYMMVGADTNTQNLVVAVEPGNREMAPAKATHYLQRFLRLSCSRQDVIEEYEDLSVVAINPKKPDEMRFTLVWYFAYFLGGSCYLHLS